jgi:hypothetical protein
MVIMGKYKLGAVTVSGRKYNRLYARENCVALAFVAPSRTLEYTLVTSLEELSTQYGLKTAVLVRTALLKAGWQV